jgi:hypothetical protein
MRYLEPITSILQARLWFDPQYDRAIAGDHRLRDTNPDFSPGIGNGVETG